MAGKKGRSGRKRKPTAELKLNGTFRPDRHGDRAHEPQPKGQLVKPAGLEFIDPVANEIWDQFIGPMADTGVFTSADAHAVNSLIWWHAKWRELAALYESTMSLRVFGAVVKAWEKFEGLAKSLGYGPIERTRMRVPDTNNGDSAPAIESFMD